MIPNIRYCFHERTEKEKLHTTMAQYFFPSLWLLVVYTLWYVSSATSVFFNFFFFKFFLCPSRLRQHFPSSPAFSAAGYGCGHKTWWPSSLAGCSPAEGRVRGSARSQPSQGLAAPWGFSLGESPLLHAPPPTRDASALRASLWGREESVNKRKCVSSDSYGCGR